MKNGVLCQAMSTWHTSHVSPGWNLFGSKRSWSNTAWHETLNTLHLDETSSDKKDWRRRLYVHFVQNKDNYKFVLGMATT